MSKPKLIALTLLFLTGAVVLAATDVPTVVTITKTTVSGPNQGIYGIGATGEMSLSNGYTLNGYSFAFNGPNGQLAPVFSPPFSAPTPGTTVGYSCTQSTAVTGKWNFSASMNWTDTNEQVHNLTVTSKPFQVG